VLYTKSHRTQSQKLCSCAVRLPPCARIGALREAFLLTFAFVLVARLKGLITRRRRVGGASIITTGAGAHANGLAVHSAQLQKSKEDIEEKGQDRVLGKHFCHERVA